MSQNFRIILDKKTISLTDPEELKEWCFKFNCRETDLKKAVKAAGKNVADVAKYFSKIK